MTYPDSIRFLYALGNEIKTVKLGLDPMRALMHELGDQQNRYRIVHAAGTNGKGSTCAMIEAGLRASGLRTGLYTSPHLIEPTERIRINGVPVTREQFQDSFDQVHQVAEALERRGILANHPTYFETVTAMAFLQFEQAQIDVLVCETGLGGRLDATNIVSPELTVITSIDFDHELYLGNTIASIAGEKAGIVKPRVPVVCSAQRYDIALEVVSNRARELSSPLVLTSDAKTEELEVTARGCRYRMQFGRVECPLAGRHQVENSLTAAVALGSLGVSPAGIRETVWPGRLERVSERPEILLDGAHNPAGAQALASYLEEFYPKRPIWMIYGTMRDKALEEIAGILFPLASQIILTSPESQRAAHPDSLRNAFPDFPVQSAANLESALELTKNAPSDALIIITGSLFLVGEARLVLCK